MNKNELNQAVDKEIKEAEAKVSLMVQNLDTNEILISFNPDNAVVSASVIKVPIMLTALALIQEGSLSIDTLIRMPETTILDDSEVFEFGEGNYTLNELLVWMIINSDNSATNCLIDFLTMDRINEYCRNLCLKSTKVERRMLDFKALKTGLNNFTSAADMKVVYKSLYDKTILTPELCDYAISILKRQRHKELSMRYICDEIIVAHKTGGLHFLNHDAGIFYLEKASYYFGAFVTEAPSNDYAMRLIGRISKLIYEYYKESKL